MTSETIPGFILGQTAAQRLLQRFRHCARRANRKVESMKLVVETHETLVIRAFILKHVRLSGLALPEGVENRQADGFLSIRNRVSALFILPLYFVSERSAAKSHDGIFGQHFGVSHRFHCHPHGTLRLRYYFVLMTLSANLIALKLDICGRSSRMPALTGTGLVEYFRTHS